LAGEISDDRAAAFRARDERREIRRMHGLAERPTRDEPLATRALGALIAAAFAAVAFFVRTLPREEALEIGATIGAIGARVLRKRRRTALANLAIAFPEKTPREHARICDRAFENVGRVVVEVIRLPVYARRGELEHEVEMENLEGFDALAADGKGVLILSGHQGCFELLAPAGNKTTKFRGALIGRKIKPQAVDAIVRGLRESCGVGTIPNKAATREVFRRLRRNEAIGVVLDQNMKGGAGVFVPFFGKLASTTPGLAIIAARSEAPVVPVFIHRRGGLGRHRIVFHPAVVWDDAGGDKKAAIIVNTARYTRIIEDEVRRRPEEWFWFHQRWRTRPPDELRAAAAADAMEEPNGDDDGDDV
jgi:KDO2-lipid IV(A) lauroyltransferase